MAEACPIASELELDLLTKLLSIDPTKRPTAKGCMEHAYFEELPEQMRPPISSPEIDRGQFDFEKEKLDMNDLRILIANDLFRFLRLEPWRVNTSQTRKAGGAVMRDSIENADEVASVLKGTVFEGQVDEEFASWSAKAAL